MERAERTDIDQHIIRLYDYLNTPINIGIIGFALLSPLRPYKEEL